MHRTSYFFTSYFFAAALAMLALIGTAGNAQQIPVPQQSLPGNVPLAVSHSRRLRHFNPAQPLAALVCFRFSDPQAAQTYADSVSDPNSLLYRQWLTPAEIGPRFGPSLENYAAVQDYFRKCGMQTEAMPPNRMTLGVRGTAAQMERAFGVSLNEYQAANETVAAQDSAPRTFFAPSAPLRLPAPLAACITSVEGLESYTRPQPLRRRRSLMDAPFDPAPLRNAYGVTPLYSANLLGQGRTIGISNYDGFDLSNARKYITHNNLPIPAAGAAKNVTVIHVADNSGSVGVGEGDLDIQMVLGFAPLANIIVYDNGKPLNNNVPQNVLAVLSREVSDNLADIITESYAWHADNTAQIASWHAQHLMMTMQGITYCVASGDNGSIVNYSYPYPDIESEVLSIGGTQVTLNPDGTIASETAWSMGGGGYNAIVHPFNALPAWQAGRGVPVDTNLRLVPDFSLHAAGSGSAGACSYYWLGYLLSVSNGTSFASPMVAGGLADAEQWMIAQGALPPDANGKQRLGRLNNAIYALNGRNDVFHDITTGDNGFAAARYWDYAAGWGTPDFHGLAAALAMPLAVSVSPAAAVVSPGSTLALTATVTGSVVKGVAWSIVSGPGSIDAATGIYTAPASVTAAQTVRVKAVSVLDTANAGNAVSIVQPDPVSGTASLAISPYVTIRGTVRLPGLSSPGAAAVPLPPFTFQFRPAGNGTPVTIAQTLDAAGAFTLSGIPAVNGTLAVKGAKWLQAVVPADASHGNVTNLSVILFSGDANNDNSVDLSDFAPLVNAFGSAYDAANPLNGYDARADFNCDGQVDLKDFNLLLITFNQSGAL